MSQISRDRYVFFFDCSEEADRDIDKSDFSVQNPEAYENDSPKLQGSNH